MSLTVNEAIERACAIWGAARTHGIKLRPDGGADVELVPAGIASDTRARNYVAHQIDANGHAVCHSDCARLEQSF